MLIPCNILDFLKPCSNYTPSQNRLNRIDKVNLVARKVVPLLQNVPLFCCIVVFIHLFNNELDCPLQLAIKNASFNVLIFNSFVNVGPGLFECFFL